MKKVFLVGLGGTVKGANIEVHDKQFVLGDHIEDCYEELKKRWYGDVLHIDTYTELKYIDGYKIVLGEVAEEKLYFIVYGGYDKNRIDEIHEYGYLLARNSKEVKEKAKLKIHEYTYADHVDSIVDVFANLGMEFHLEKGVYSFDDNETIHTYIPLKNA